MSDKDDNDSTQNKEIILSTKTIDLKCGNTSSIDISGVNGTDCDIIVDDEFVVFVSASKNKINITAKKVGETQITLKYEGEEKIISVYVSPSTNYIGKIYIDFNATKQEIIEHEGIEAENVKDSYLYKFDSQTRFWSQYYYRLRNNKLDYAFIKASVKKANNDYYVLTEHLKEFGDFDEIFYASKFGGNIYLYKRSNDYYIGLREIGVSDDQGWWIVFAKSKDQLKDLLNTDSHIYSL